MDEVKFNFLNEWFELTEVLIRLVLWWPTLEPGFQILCYHFLFQWILGFKEVDLLITLSETSQCFTSFDQAGRSSKCDDACKSVLKLGNQSPARGFFIKKKESRPSSPDSQIDKLFLLSPVKQFKMAPNTVPIDPGFEREAESSRLKLLNIWLESSNIMLTRELGLQSKKKFNIFKEGRMQTLSIANPIPARLRSGNLEFSFPNRVVPECEGSIVTSRTLGSQILEKGEPAGRRVHLNDLLMDQDWQNKTVDFDQISELTNQKCGKFKALTPCIKSMYKITKKTHFRFKSVPAVQSAQNSLFELRQESQHSTSKTVSFSKNVLVYIY